MKSRKQKNEPQEEPQVSEEMPSVDEVESPVEHTTAEDYMVLSGTYSAPRDEAPSEDPVPSVEDGTDFETETVMCTVESRSAAVQSGKPYPIRIGHTTYVFQPPDYSLELPISIAQKYHDSKLPIVIQ